MHSWIKTFNSGKMSIFPKLIYTFSIISIKRAVCFFSEIEKLIINLIQKYKGPRTAKTK